MSRMNNKRWSTLPALPSKKKLCVNGRNTPNLLDTGEEPEEKNLSSDTSTVSIGM